MILIFVSLPYFKMLLRSFFIYLPSIFFVLLINILFTDKVCSFLYSYYFFFFFFLRKLYSYYFIYILVKILRLIWLPNFCSSFGQGLQTSNYLWESCFSIFISILGLLQFLYFLENLKVLLNSFFSPFLTKKGFEIVVVVGWGCWLLAELRGGTTHLWLCED